LIPIAAAPAKSEQLIGIALGIKRGYKVRKEATPPPGSEIAVPPSKGTAMRREFLPFSPPDIGEAEIDEVVDSLRSGWITTGPKTKRFQEEFAAYVGAPAALAVSSGTAAMHLGLVVAGIGPGDEVITTPLTFCSTVAVIEHTGARPVLVDVEPDTLNVDPQQIAAAITPRTRGILPVHYGGHPVALDAIAELARDHSLALIEDAAHALPARYAGRMIGSADNPVAFSFYATKNVTCAEGGMLTAAPELIARAEIAHLHGMDRDAWRRYGQGGSWYYEVVMPGYKYNLTDIQAAIGLHQLRKLANRQERRHEIVARYGEAFHEFDALELPVVRPEVESAWHLYPLRLRTEQLTIDRDRFIEEMSARNIGTSVHFIPIHLHRYYRERYGWRPDDFPVALANYQRLLSLPLNSRLSDQDVDDVCAAVIDIVSRHRR
jgi:dTDP-4-amino-4,6-dideoxygalactose transaminase